MNATDQPAVRLLTASRILPSCRLSWAVAPPRPAVRAGAAGSAAAGVGVVVGVAQLAINRPKITSVAITNESLDRMSVLLLQETANVVTQAPGVELVGELTAQGTLQTSISTPSAYGHRNQQLTLSVLVSDR